MTHPDTHTELVLARVRLYARRRVAWLRKLWKEEGETGGQVAVTHAEINTLLDDLDSPAAEAAWYSTCEEIKPLNKEIESVEAALGQDESSRFAALKKIFGFSREESDLFQLCLAARLDPSLGRLYAYLQDHAGRGYVTEELARRLFGYGHYGVWKKDSSLARWKLIHEKEGVAGEPSELNCDTFVFHWLLGQETLDEVLAPHATFRSPQQPLQSWPAGSTANLLERMLHGGSAKVRLILSGPGGSGRRTMAAILAAGFDKRLLVINSDHSDFSTLYLHAQRKAILDQCVIAWTGTNASEHPWPQEMPCYPLQCLICDPGKTPKPVSGFTDVVVEMPELSISEQDELIRKMVPVASAWDPLMLSQLIAQHRLNIGDIVSMREKDIQTVEEAAQVIRENSRHRLGSLAQLLECPFSWDDMVLNDFLKDTLGDFVFEARERKEFWENERIRKMFPQGRGLVGLFSGAPGTGKTMAAQVIAAQLGLDLYRIDLSSVVSKYVGETSQNLEKILSQAAFMDVVLLFDEADALFGKRTEVKDAHDRFANTDTNYLLQAIENYKGIAILATNKKENIDSAFTRRLRYVLEFPRPDARQRGEIWVKILQKILPQESGFSFNGELGILASQVEITGAQIKFAVLSAAFSAKREQKPIGMAHLLRGIERELMKEGRTLGKLEREKLLSHAG
ncbi:MAG: ATP-binding protein [Bacteroidetes bacterium]|nr:ATP-binding protein [Bacteroidota bacterium]